jgi:hypothetical protein
MGVEGIFPDVVGLTYRSGTETGVTSSDFKFHFEQGTKITFSVGDLVLGGCDGKKLVSFFDLVPAGTPALDPKVVNRARLLFSLSRGQGFENPIIIDNEVRASK